MLISNGVFQPRGHRAGCGGEGTDGRAREERGERVKTRGSNYRMWRFIKYNISLFSSSAYAISLPKKPTYSQKIYYRPIFQVNRASLPIAHRHGKIRQTIFLPLRLKSERGEDTAPRTCVSYIRTKITRLIPPSPLSPPLFQDVKKGNKSKDNDSNVNK